VSDPSSPSSRIGDPEEVGDALDVLRRVAEETGATLRFDRGDEKHEIEGDGERVIANA
jgi:hypothetical protein